MKRLENRSVLAAGMGLSIAAVALLLLSTGFVRPGVTEWGLALAGAAGLAIAAGFLIRTGRFLRRLRQFVRRLLANQYETGMPGEKRPADILGRLASLLDQLADHLRTYDRLRAERVRVSRLAMDMLMKHVPHPVMLFDAERETLDLNPSMRSLLDTSTSQFMLSALEKLDDNSDFAALIRGNKGDEKGRQEGYVTLRFPSEESGRKMKLQALSVYDRDGKLQSVLVMTSGTSSEAGE